MSYERDTSLAARLPEHLQSSEINPIAIELTGLILRELNQESVLANHPEAGAYLVFPDLGSTEPEEQEVEDDLIKLNGERLIVDKEHSEVVIDGELIKPQKKIFDCLSYLAVNSNRAVYRPDFCVLLWNRYNPITSRRLSQTIYRVRELLEPSGMNAMLCTISKDIVMLLDHIPEPEV